jgi:ABC-type multidrug transport system fused ATPase/permease subunit
VGEKDNLVLENISLEIEPGQLVVIVGENGTGKSTLLKLIARLLKPSRGAIFIDGRPSEAYNIQQLRDSMAIILQTDCLYDLPLGENILVGIDNVPIGKELDLKLNKAISLGGAEDLVERHGLDGLWNVKNSYQPFSFHRAGLEFNRLLNDNLPVRRDRTQLSMGERQRLFAYVEFRPIFRVVYTNVCLSIKFPSLHANALQGC